MREHTPRRQKEKKAVAIDWEARDADLSAAVRRSAERLMSAPGRPVRVSAEAIARDTGEHCQFDHKVILAQCRINNLPVFFDHNLILRSSVG
jgi:hypothetical protein